jgi:hypothetical protein
VKRRRLIARTLLTAAIGLGLLGCRSEGITIVNRSAIAISPAPGYVVAPCAERRFDASDLERMNALVVQYTLGTIDTWPPPGAARWEDGLMLNDDRSVFLLITSVAKPQRLAERPQPADLPACGGIPVGVALPEGSAP